MKAVILAGGLGTRISEETHLRPKPMIEIGGKPILWHIMKIYSNYGINEFIICCGYKGYIIKEYFANYLLHNSDVTINTLKDEIKIHKQYAEPWSVTLVDTGENTQTGGRLKRITEYINKKESFCMTYGDGLSDVNISAQIEFHKSHGKKATVTAVMPPGKYGALNFEQDKITNFTEKPVGDGGYINGGFFVISPECLELIGNDDSSWENDILPVLVSQAELIGYKHKGFWRPMDTLRDKKILEQMWENGKAPWMVW